MIHPANFSFAQYEPYQRERLYYCYKLSFGQEQLIQLSEQQVQMSNQTIPLNTIQFRTSLSQSRNKVGPNQGITPYKFLTVQRPSKMNDINEIENIKIQRDELVEFINHLSRSLPEAEKKINSQRSILSSQVKNWIRSIFEKLCELQQQKELFQKAVNFEILIPNTIPVRNFNQFVIAAMSNELKITNSIMTHNLKFEQILSNHHFSPLANDIFARATQLKKKEEILQRLNQDLRAELVNLRKASSIRNEKFQQITEMGILNVYQQIKSRSPANTIQQRGISSPRVSKQPHLMSPYVKSEVQDQTSQKLIQSQNEKAALQAKISQQQKKVFQLNKQKSDIENENRSLNCKYLAFQSQQKKKLEEQTKKLQAKIYELAAFKKQFDEKCNQYNILTQKIKETQVSNNDLSDQLYRIKANQGKRSNLERQFSLLQQSFNDLKQDKQKGQKQANAYKAEINKLNQIIQNLQKEVHKWAQSNQNLQINLGIVNSKVDQQNNEKLSLQNSNQQLKKEFERNRLQLQGSKLSNDQWKNTNIEKLRAMELQNENLRKRLGDAELQIQRRTADAKREISKIQTTAESRWNQQKQELNKTKDAISISNYQLTSSLKLKTEQLQEQVRQNAALGIRIKQLEQYQRRSQPQIAQLNSICGKLKKELELKTNQLEQQSRNNEYLKAKINELQQARSKQPSSQQLADKERIISKQTLKFKELIDIKEKQEGKLKAKNQEIDYLTEQVNKLNIILEEMNEHGVCNNSDIMVVKDEQFRQSQQKCIQLERKISLLENDIEQRKRNFERFKGILTSRQTQIAELNAKIRQTSSDASAENAKLSKLNNSSNQLMEQNKKLKQSIQDYRRLLKQSQKKIGGNFSQMARINSFFQNEILDNFYDYKEYLTKSIEDYMRLSIKKTKLIYSYDKLNRINFHKYFDNKDNLVVIVKTIYGNFTAAYTEGPFSFGKGSDRDGLIISITNQKCFTLAQRNRRAITYDDYYLIFGNSELRIKSQENLIFSNFGISNSYYDSRGERVNVLLGGGPQQRQVEFENFQIYQLIFDY